MSIPFNRPPKTGKEYINIKKVLMRDKLSGDGEFGKRCQNWFETRYANSKCLLTPSCTASLELAALLINIKPGDEVIMPSYTFVSTANAFVLRGAKIVFVDIRPDTMNIDESLIEAAISPKTKAIVPVHYAGVACEMEIIMEIANKFGLFVIEDAAQGVASHYKGQALGTIGHLGAFSFHETKNYTSGGEGGLLLINDKRFIERAEIIREKGTNRSQFFRGMVDKYQWVDIGSSYLPSELQAAYLMAQLDEFDVINDSRIQSWNYYYERLGELRSAGLIELPIVPKECSHNAHMFYIKVKDLKERSALIKALNKNDVYPAFHYVPLHSSKAGVKSGRFNGNDLFTTVESERILRLPLWYGLSFAQQDVVIDTIKYFFDPHNC